MPESVEIRVGESSPLVNMKLYSLDRGMGILVFMMAVMPMSKEYSMHIMRAEIPSPEAGKLTPKIQRSSLILYLIYIFLTIAEVVALLICKMPFFDSVVHAFGTAGTGGFGIENTSIGAYSSPAIDIVIAVFQNSPVCLYAYGQT